MKLDDVENSEIRVHLLHPMCWRSFRSKSSPNSCHLASYQLIWRGSRSESGPVSHDKLHTNAIRTDILSAEDPHLPTPSGRHLDSKCQQECTRSITACIILLLVSNTTRLVRTIVRNVGRVTYRVPHVGQWLDTRLANCFSPLLIIRPGRLRHSLVDFGTTAFTEIEGWMAPDALLLQTNTYLGVILFMFDDFSVGVFQAAKYFWQDNNTGIVALTIVGAIGDRSVDGHVASSLR